jgi:TRAP transporter TAXI family solute receptor
MGISVSTVRNTLLLTCVLLTFPLQLAQAQSKKAWASYEEQRRQTNDIAVTVITSGLSCTCARFAEDIRNVVNDLRPDGVRVLPVLGVGGLQNVNDLLFLKGIDLAVVDEDNLRLLKKRDPQLYSNVEQRVQYITKLYNSEFHVLARNDIKTYDDLRGKPVSFNLSDSQTEVTADNIFNALKLDVRRVNYDNDEAIKKLREGDIAAMIVLSGAPQAALAKLKKEDGVHFLALDAESLPNRDLRPILSEYLPAEITHEHYPNLIDEGKSVPTIANRALLVAYAAQEDTVRYKRVSKFVREFFGKIDQFHSSARHPKWSEVNLSAEIPGWTRFKPAAEWLAARRSAVMAMVPDQSNPAARTPAELRSAFERFIENFTTSSGQRSLSTRERDVLFVQFMQFLEPQGREQATR